MNPDAPKQPTAYENNPFFIATRGINALFTQAQPVTITLVILSVLYFINSNNSQAYIQNTYNTAKSIPDWSALTPLIPLMIIGLLVVIAFNTIVSGMSAYTSAQVAKGESVTLKEALLAVLRAFWPYLWLQVLTALKIIAWLLLFIVPGVIMATRYWLAPVAFFDKGLRGNAAIKHSITLTKKSWFTTFASRVLFTTLTLNVIDLLVGAGVQTTLYRQFSAVPNDKRPKTHWLSLLIVTMLITSAAFLVSGIILALILHPTK